MSIPHSLGVRWTHVAVVCLGWAGCVTETPPPAPIVRPWYAVKLPADHAVDQVAALSDGRIVVASRNYAATAESERLTALSRCRFPPARGYSRHSNPMARCRPPSSASSFDVVSSGDPPMPVVRTSVSRPPTPRT